MGGDDAMTLKPLLQPVCGRCGRMMTVRYHYCRGRLRPEYLCQKDCVEAARAVCQRIPGGELDEAIGRLLVQSVTPLALEVALNVQIEIQTRLDEADRLRQQHVQRAQYEADQAKLRFMRVDPNNRLVADTLETTWNEKLRHLAQAKEEYEKQRQNTAVQLTAQQKAKVLALATDVDRSYQKAPVALKRQYLGLFWERFLVEDREIVKAVPSRLIRDLLDVQ
jgi:hypothetical protein